MFIYKKLTTFLSLILLLVGYMSIEVLFNSWDTIALPVGYASDEIPSGVLISPNEGKQVNVLNKNIALQQNGSISGVVRDNSNNPINNIKVELHGELYGDGVCTDANGAYSFTVGIDNWYRVSVGESYDDCSGNNNYARTFYGNTGNWSNATVLTPTAAQPNLVADIIAGPGATVSGFVSDVSTNTPLSTIHVNITDRNGNDFWHNACTDANGQYTVYGVPLNVDMIVETDPQAAPDYVSWCRSAANVNYIPQYWNNKFNWDEADSLNITGPRNGIDFALELGGHIEGTVYDSNGNPLSGMKVAVHGNNYRDTCTDANGNFAIYGLRFNTDYEPAAGGYDPWCGGVQKYARQFWNGDFDWGSGQIFTPTASVPSATAVDFSLNEGTLITGIVEDTNSNPLGNVNVTILEGFWRLDGTCSDNTNGTYAFIAPYGRTLRVVAADDNWCSNTNNYALELYNNTTDFDAAQLITTVPGNPTYTDINFSLVSGSIISGNIVVAENGSPLVNKWVCAIPADTNSLNFGKLWNCAPTDSNGDYTLYSLPSGNYYVRSSTWSDGTYRESAFYDDANTLEGSVTITVTTGSTTTGVNFSLQLGGRISGQITNQSGVGIDGIEVYVNNSEYPVCTGNDGSYELLVPSGTYTVTANDTGRCGQPTESFSSQTYPLQVSVTNEQDTDGINFTKGETPGAITGQLTASEDGTGLANIGLCAMDFNIITYSQDPTWDCSMTDANGNYSLVTESGQKRIWVFPNDRQRLFYDQANTFDSASPVTVSPGSTTSNINFALPLASIIEGLVTDINGNPLNGIDLWVQPAIGAGEHLYPECTSVSNGGDDGRYKLYVPAGTWYVFASVNGPCGYGGYFPEQVYVTTVTTTLEQTVSNINFQVILDPDFNNDNVVSSTDVIYVVNRIGTDDLSVDLNNDGSVDAVDAQMVIDALGTDNR